jgi:flagellar M-ring protein FliF
MDFDRVETREERFDPENQVARSQQSTTEQNRGAEPPPTTVAGNLPGNEAPGGAGTSENRQEETTNYEIGRSTRNTLREHPVVKRLSVAVLVDGLVEGEPPRWRERGPEELARIAALVRSAVGFDERRGDKVEVVSMRFVEEPLAAEAAPGFLGLPLSPALATRLAESALLALVALAGILLVGRPMVGRIAASLAPVAALAGPNGGMAGEMGNAALAGGAPGMAALAGGGGEGGAPALSSVTDAAALSTAEEAMVSLAHVQGQMRASSLNALSQMVQRHPDESLAVLRRWLDPEDRL